ncbi:MAG: hypothetical protein IMW89_02260 [Ktedonobacteraceae bacterium]|nr:hypothetical protein [Ktedonobacteraceae bacterium]
MLNLDWLVRAVHILAGAIWVGGSVMYLLVVQPALRSTEAVPALAARIAALFKRMVNVCIAVLLLSGAYLMFDRLTQTTLALPYVIVLVLKIAAALIMFLLAIYLAQSRIRQLAKQTTRFSRIVPQLTLVLGILVFILGALLNSLFEATLAPH